MPYVRRYGKKPFRKAPSKSSATNKKIARIAKTVALRQQETKHVIIAHPARDTYHNQSYLIDTNLINISQGVNDGSHRIGDEVTLRGLKVYMDFESIWDRPNTTWRVVICKCRADISSGGASLPTKLIMNNPVIDPLDMEQIQKVYVNKRFRFGNKDTQIDTAGEGVSTLNRPTTNFRTMWIPLNNTQYKFTHGSSDVGRDYNITCWIAAYDHSSMLSTDKIGVVRLATELFFKDA